MKRLGTAHIPQRPPPEVRSRTCAARHGCGGGRGDHHRAKTCGAFDWFADAFAFWCFFFLGFHFLGEKIWRGFFWKEQAKITTAEVAEECGVVVALLHFQRFDADDGRPADLSLLLLRQPSASPLVGVTHCYHCSPSPPGSRSLHLVARQAKKQATLETGWLE